MHGEEWVSKIVELQQRLIETMRKSLDRTTAKPRVVEVGSQSQARDWSDNEVGGSDHSSPLVSSDPDA